MPRLSHQKLLLFVTALMLFSGIATIFMYTKVQERDAYMHALESLALSGTPCNSRTDTVLVLAREIFKLTNNDHGISLNKLDWYERFESTFFFNMTSTVALKYGGYGVRGHFVFGPCGTMSRTLLNALWELDIPARKLQLMKNSEGKGGGHTLVEFYDEGKWKVIAPSDSAFVWRNEQGDVATAQEIKQNRAIFNQIYKQHPNFSYLFDNPKNINWEKLPSWMIPIIKFCVGEEKFNTIQTPQLYDKPRHALLYFFIFLFLSSTLILLYIVYAPRILASSEKKL